MSTNYYVRTNECACCGRFDSLHMGSTCRILRAYTSDEMHGAGAIASLADWREWITINGAHIVNEYGDPCPDILDAWQPRLHAAAESNREWSARFGHGLGDFTDPEGFHMSPREFS